ncbi:MAG: RDD family protein [Anaerolineae bacterium]|nr:RDD family protein [Anaerolineae bacterium]
MTVYEKPKRDIGTSYELAGFGTRFFAYIIDGIIIGLIAGLLFGSARWAGGGLGWLVGMAYCWYFWTRQDGQTLGKKVMNVRVIRTDGAPLTDSDAILRYIGYYISGLLLGLGFLWALFDSKTQALHDKLANTYVVVAE